MATAAVVDSSSSWDPHASTTEVGSVSSSNEEAPPSPSPPPPPSPPPAPKPSANVRVVARIRPLSGTEIQRGSIESVTSLLSNFGGSSLNSGSGDPECLQVKSDGNDKRFFELDKVFDKQCSQEQVYRQCGAQQAVTQDLFTGFNCTILAYGQTGAGKTFTMGTAHAGAAGDEAAGSSTISEMDGMIPRACQDLFDTISTKCDGNATVELSYLEIYNEEIRDLMASNNKKNKLLIREKLNGEVYVQGVEYRSVASPRDVGQCMQEAASRRVVASTAMNAVSSRSHAICTLRVRGVLPNADKFCSKLTLVDLAGSERIKKTGAQGNRRQEGININKGLFVLGQVVGALSDAGSGKRTRKPPYRDSKLTRLLQDSLGGNSRTIMVACVSPADYNTEESLNTLRYATSARNIKNTATRNLITQISPEEAQKLQRENQLLKNQVAELQAAIQSLTEQRQLQVQVEQLNSSSAIDASATDIRSSQPPVRTVKLSGKEALELPALHVEVELLRSQIAELQQVESENAELRAELQAAQSDAASARKAASQLSDIMDQLQACQQSELEQKRQAYNHAKREEAWVSFASDMLQSQLGQVQELAQGFDVVQSLVENPIVAKHGNKVLQRGGAAGQRGAAGNGWFARGKERLVERYNNHRTGGNVTPTNSTHGYSNNNSSHGSVSGSQHGGRSVSNSQHGGSSSVTPDDPEDFYMQVLKEHMNHFSSRLTNVNVHITQGSDSLQAVQQTLADQVEELEAEIGQDEVHLDSINRQDNILSQLTTMLLQPVSVLAAQDPSLVGATEQEKSPSTKQDQPAANSPPTSKQERLLLDQAAHDDSYEMPDDIDPNDFPPAERGYYEQRRGKHVRVCDA